LVPLVGSFTVVHDSATEFDVTVPSESVGAAGAAVSSLNVAVLDVSAVPIESTA